jgi:hypothetical protein
MRRSPITDSELSPGRHKGRAKTEKERAKEKCYRRKTSILTETKEKEKKKNSDEHGPELYVGVEEREGPSRGRVSCCGCCCQHDA